MFRVRVRVLRSESAYCLLWRARYTRSGGYRNNGGAWEQLTEWSLASRHIALSTETGRTSGAPHSGSVKLGAAALSRGSFGRVERACHRRETHGKENTKTWPAPLHQAGRVLAAASEVTTSGVWAAWIRGRAAQPRAGASRGQHAATPTHSPLVNMQFPDINHTCTHDTLHCTHIRDKTILTSARLESTQLFLITWSYTGVKKYF